MVSVAMVVGALDSMAKRDLEREIMASVAVKAAVIDTAKKVQKRWKEIAPVSDRPAHPLQVGGSYIEEPGDYQKSIRVKYDTHGPDVFGAQVYSKDPKAHWLEYGSVHNPEYGYAARVVEEFGGSDYQVHV